MSQLIKIYYSLVNMKSGASNIVLLLITEYQQSHLSLYTHFAKQADQLRCFSYCFKKETSKTIVKQKRKFVNNLCIKNQCKYKSSSREHCLSITEAEANQIVYLQRGKRKIDLNVLMDHDQIISLHVQGFKNQKLKNLNLVIVDA